MDEYKGNIDGDASASNRRISKIDAAALNKVENEENKDYEDVPGSDNVLRESVAMFHGRQYLETKPIEPTVLNNTKIDIKVGDGLVKEGGIFTSNYVTYSINTYP